MARMDTPTPLPNLPPNLLPILVSTEDGRVRAGVTEAELATLLTGLGTVGNRYAVVEHAKIEDQVFIQAWRGDDGAYRVEHRAGSPQQHFTLGTTNPAHVADLLISWARGDSSWLAADWKPTARATTD
jgi:hypothetical protein